MRFPQKFPYTTINNINLDWIIKKVKEALRTANEAADDVSGAIEAAAAAEASAAEASAAAAEAVEAAEGVVETAAEALTTAQAAQTTAEGIAGTASQALTTAQYAQTTANSANTTAQAAQTTAEGIASTANTALTTAQAAQTAAEDAQDTAEGVESIAQGAQTTASQALTAANNANTTAQAAQTTANSKCEIHDNAITTLTTWSSQKIRNEIDSATPSGLVSYAEAQTLTAAQQKQARSNIGSNWTLLWQNASPTSAFAGQVITVDYSAFDFLAIVIRNRTDQTPQQTVIFKAENGGGYTSSKNTLVGGSNVYLQYREGILNANGLSIANGWEATIRSGGTISVPADSNLLIPVELYGIKNL